MLDQWLLIIFGFLIAIAAALTGVGGGIFTVPVLTLLYGFENTSAIGTSLAMIIFTAAAATINYARQRRIRYTTGVLLAITTTPGALLGAWLTTVLREQELGLAFSFFLFAVAIRIIINSRRSSSESDEQKERTTALKSYQRSGFLWKKVSAGIIVGFFAGVASGLLGIGGGILVVPVMTFVLAIPIHMATATSMFTMIFTSLAGILPHYEAGHIAPDAMILLAAGAIFGAQVGAHISKRLSGKNLRLIFAVMLLIAGLNMLVKNWPQ